MRAALLVGLALLIMAGASLAWYRAEIAESPLLSAALREGDVGTLSRLARADPAIEGRTFLGDPGAPITVVAYAVPGTAQARSLALDVLPLLDGYARNGTLRYDVRVPLALSDVRRRSEQYLAAKAIACLPADAPLQREILIEGAKALKSLPGYTMGESGPSCLWGDDPAALSEDIGDARALGIATTPVLAFGIDGQDTSLLVGIPGEERLRQMVREYERRIGE